MSDNFDPFQTLTDHAEHLNAICVPNLSAKVSYEVMSGALVWSDEMNSTTSIEVIWALRLVFAYRTSLMLNTSREEFKPIWNHGLSQFPNWVGFLPERRQPTPELLQIYRREHVSLRKCLKNAERMMKKAGGLREPPPASL